MNKRRQCALDFAKRDFPLLEPEETIQEALNKFRKTGLPHKIIYFYVVDKDRKLIGVVPTRLLLTQDLTTRVKKVFIPKIVALPEDASVEEARQAFSKHKFLAFPIVDRQGRVVGVLDIEEFAGDLGNIHERTGYDDIYDLLGLQGSLKAEGHPIRSFKMRFPWLVSTIFAGTIGAFLSGYFESTLREAIILSFFLTLVLGLNESVCMQSATLSLQRLHHNTKAPFWKNLMREGGTGLILGLVCGFIGGLVAGLWQGNWESTFAVGLSLWITIALSCLWGMGVPHLLKRFLGDPRVAAGPLALALSDITTLSIYFVLGRHFLGSH